MKQLCKIKVPIYDPKIGQIGPMYSPVGCLSFRLSEIFLILGSKLTGIEVSRTEVPSYLLFPCLFGTREREVIAWYRQYLQPGIWFIDIGAYVVYYIIRFAKLVRQNRKAVVVERYNLSFEILKQNV
jgi:hypothetical protein